MAARFWCSWPKVPGLIKGADKEYVVNAHDVLNGKVEVSGKVVVIGGGLVGAETADALCRSCKVSIVEMLPQIIRDGEYSPVYYMKQRFQEFGVDVHTSTKLLEIGDHTVIAEHAGQEFVIDNVDYVIIAVGVRTNPTLLEHLDQLDCPVLKVGDANGVKNGYWGIREGYEAGLRV